MNYKVTWLIPILNGMPYLSEMLASIESQTYKNWEVLVWDNGSTDGTLEELEKWIPNRLPGKVFIGEPHGVGGSLKRLVEECTTEFCARIDADDINLPERLEKQIAFLEARPEVAVLGSQIHLLNELGNQFGEVYLPLFPTDHENIVNEMLFRSPISHPSVVLRRSAILQVGNYRDKCYIEDYDLWLRVSQKYKIANLDIPLVKYRIHQSSTTHLAIKENRLYKVFDDCISGNALLTFGCSENDMRLLRSGSHPLAIKPLLQIAKYLHQSSRGVFIDKITSPSFYNIAKNLIPARDVMSRLYMAALHPNKPVLFQEIKDILNDIVKKVRRQILNRFLH